MLKETYDCLNPDLWENFLSLDHVIPATRDGLDDWHKGRERYWVWVVEVSSSAIESRTEAFRQCLSPCLLGGYKRQAHITISIAGFLKSAQDTSQKMNDDFVEEDLISKVKRLLLSKIKPFSLWVYGFNSFASAPILEVEDHSKSLDVIREKVFGNTDDFRTETYRPHITLGLYGKAISPMVIVDSVAEGLYSQKPIEVVVNSIALASYCSHELQGSLRIERRFVFR